MSIAQKLTTIAENESKVYEAGQKSERNAFWEVYQNRFSDSYFWAFGNNSFTDETYNPIKPIICAENGAQSSQSMFRENRLLTDTKVEIQASADNMNYCFFSAIKLKTIRKITVFETTKFNSTFQNCKALENITFGGVIGDDINFGDCTLLTHESLMSIINALKDFSVKETLHYPDAEFSISGYNDDYRGISFNVTSASLSGTTLTCKCYAYDAEDVIFKAFGVDISEDDLQYIKEITIAVTDVDENGDTTTEVQILLSKATTTKTLTLGTTNLAKLTEEEKAKATDKGWILA